MTEPPAALARSLRDQAAGCLRLGAPLYAGLLDRCAEDVASGGVTWELLEPHSTEPAALALALRLLAPVHGLVLDGRLPGLERHYRSAAAGSADLEPAWISFREALTSHFDWLRGELSRGCQTNEVGRCAALLGGFLAVADRTGLPLRLLEPGSSAGLNLRWDRYFYSEGGFAWGEPDSPVRLEKAFEAPPPLPRRRLRISARHGCDLDPVDISDPSARLRLRSFVWPEHPDRMAQLEGALRIAASVPATVDRADAVKWLEESLQRPQSGSATVVFHSIFMQYLGERSRRRLVGLITTAGSWAAADAPLAWLRLEPNGTRYEVRLTVWPGGREELLAISSPHGAAVRWLGSGPG